MAHTRDTNKVDYVGLIEAAEMMECSAGRVLELLADGSIPGYMAAGERKWALRRADIEQWVASSTLG